MRKKKGLTPSPSPARTGGLVLPHQQTIYLHHESAGIGGKAVTVVKNLVLSAHGMKSLAKRRDVKDGVIQIQGEHRDKIAGLLMEVGV